MLMIERCGYSSNPREPTINPGHQVAVELNGTAVWTRNETRDETLFRGTVKTQGAALGDSIQPEEFQVSATQGVAVTLRCSYSTTYTSGYYLYWYRQHRDRALQYILYRGTKELTAPESAESVPVRTVMQISLTLGVWVLGMLATTQGNSIQSQESQESRGEGDSVTLHCSYSTSDEYVYLYWYRQYPNRALQYILYRGARSRSSATHTAGFAQKRFSSQADRTTTLLVISALELADTAVYYCALRLTP
ncbi:hypothetical protein Y1Q_0010593 [Alligator mississippiensis]|uniref:Ig-like domain-containing protein n=1 Tax=Alligator mississippiensis TaxID=8496 RepID=A0A151PH34_ALLMI|nr:hypothetical protein Y1Q_0010593 [Alligator mississippiensis]